MPIDKDRDKDRDNDSDNAPGDPRPPRICFRSTTTATITVDDWDHLPPASGSGNIQWKRTKLR
jgi:hypothetical protein